jgi:hypothetical protein
MTERRSPASEQSLLRELRLAEEAFASGGMRFSAVCWMATVVCDLPPGPVQEQAEDRLSALIGRADLTRAELRHVRMLRGDGLQARGWAAGITLRKGL